MESPQRSLFSEAGRSAQVLQHVSACHELFFHANGERLQFLRLLEQPVGNLEEAMKLLAQAGHRQDWVKKLVALSVGREVPLQIGSRTICIGGSTDVPAGLASGQTEILQECLAHPTKDHEKWRITTACTGVRMKSRQLTGLTAPRPAVEAALRLAYLADTPLQLTLRAVESTMKAGGYFLIEEARLLSDPRPYIENLFRVAASG